MCLAEARPGQVLRITCIPDASVRAQAIRFGIGEGAVVICSEVLPGGPVVVQLRQQEIALGRKLAESITVEPAALEAVGHRGDAA